MVSGSGGRQRGQAILEGQETSTQDTRSKDQHKVLNPFHLTNRYSKEVGGLKLLLLFSTLKLCDLQRTSNVFQQINVKSYLPPEDV